MNTSVELSRSHRRLANDRNRRNLALRHGIREGRQSLPAAVIPLAGRTVGYGEGFRMPAHGDLSARTEGRRPKAPQEGTRGGRVSGRRLWGFDGAAAWVGDALAGVVGVGSTIAVPGSLSLRRSTVRFWPDRKCKGGL